MDKAEFSIFASALRTYYSKENLLPNSQAMELWFRQLKDIPYKVAETVLEKWVATNKWSPSIAEIRESAAGLQNGEQPDWGEAWNELLKAIGRFGFYREKEAMNFLSPLTREVVKRLGWKNLCMSDNQTADRANFRQCFEMLIQREKQDQVIPLQLKETIKQIQSNMLMISGKENE